MNGAEFKTKKHNKYRRNKHRVLSHTRLRHHLDFVLLVKTKIIVPRKPFRAN